MTITERHRAMWSRAADYTRPSRTPESEQPRAYSRPRGRPSAKVTEELEVEPDAPEMVQAVR